jgi:phage FluMu protein Com
MKQKIKCVNCGKRFVIVQEGNLPSKCPYCKVFTEFVTKTGRWCPLCKMFHPLDSVCWNEIAKMKGDLIG